MRVLITGTSQGLGYELTQEGLRRGHQILATQRRMTEPARELQKRYPDRLSVTTMDVSSDDSVGKAAAAIAEQAPALDGLINNAAILLETKHFDGDPIVDMDLADFYRTMDVNLNGVVRVCKTFLPLIYQGGDRFVLNVTSEGAKLSTEGFIYPAYSVSKYALNMYTQILRNYVTAQNKGVRVLMVHPGRMQTVMGAENAQIPASVPACGIWDIIERKRTVEREDIPFIDYNGNYMG